MAVDSEKLVEAYERIAKKTKDLFEESKEKTSEALENAMEAARDSLEKAEEITVEESQRVKDFLKRDLEQTAKDIKTVEDYTVEHFKPSSIRLGFYELLSSLSHGSAQLFENMADWADKEVYIHTGEITAPTKLECSSCGTELHFEDSGHVPPCPKCRHTEFKRKA